MRAESSVETLRRQQRLIFRCVTTFLVDVTARQIRGHGGDFTLAIVHMAAIQASRSPVSGAAPAQPPRTFSVRAIAQSLAMPYETTRRKISELEAGGRAQRVGNRGYTVSRSLSDGPLYHADNEATWRALKATIGDLHALGFDFTQFAGGSILRATRDLTGADLADAVSVLVNDFLLRVFEEGVEPHGSMIDAVVFCTMLLVNAELVTHDPQLAWAYAGAETPPPDSLRRPATITGLAQSLGLTHETVRRRVRHQRDKGWILRQTGGYLISMDRMQAPEVLQTGLVISQRFLQLLESIRALGVDIDRIARDATVTAA